MCQWHTVDFGKNETHCLLCYVDDLIEGFVKLVNNSSYKAGPGNLGNPCEFTMLELAEAVLFHTKSSSKLVFKPLPQDDPRQRRPDITLAKTKLDWEPKVSLNDGLKETISYFKYELNS